MDAGNLISGSSAFSKSSLNIWKFSVHILLKPALENFEHYFARVGFPGGSVDKAFTRNEGDPGSILVSGRLLGEVNGNPLQYSCLEDPRNGGAWWAAAYGVAESDMTEAT